MIRQLNAAFTAVSVVFVSTQGQAPVFVDRVHLVPIYATVRGADGRLLTDLKVDQFAVLDNGQPRPIAAFLDESASITVGGMWDVSLSMEKVKDRERAAARAFVDALWPDDRLRFGTFGDAIVFSPLLTSDKPTLRRIVDEEIWFGGATPLWTVIDESIRRLGNETGRRVLVVFSDGSAKGDPTSKADLLRKMQRTDCMVYAVGLEGPGLSASLKGVAENSGGAHVILNRTADLDREFGEVLSEIHHEYLIGFIPDNLDDATHRLEVRTTVAGASVRARQSYVASKGDQ